MGLLDEIKRLARPYEDEEEPEFEDEYEEEGRSDYSDRRSSRSDYSERKSAPKKSDPVPYTADPDRRGNKVLNIHTTTQLQVVLVKPDRFENVARRILDFLSGAAYANDGKVKKVALSTYIITPYNVDILFSGLAWAR